MSQFENVRDERGSPNARCTCDICGTQKVIRCDQAERTRVASRANVNVAQAIVKLSADGWTYIKKTLRCPQCEAARKEKNVSKEPTVITIAPPTVAPLRQPTREQKRMIVAALDDAYDMANLRYKGLETDKGIADMLADGIMPGWVAAVREDMFGPDGNEEMTDLAAELKAWMKKVDDGMEVVRMAMAEVDTARTEVRNYQVRLNKIVAAIGPKAEKV